MSQEKRSAKLHGPPIGRHAKKHKGGKALAPEKVCGVIYELYEQKVKEDVNDEAHGRQPQTFVEFFEDFFLRRFGLKKMANAKLAEMIFSVEKHKGRHARIEHFAVLCGLSRPELYSPHVAETFLYMLRCVYDGAHSAIKERLDDGEGESRVSAREALNAVLGVGGQPGARQTWTMRPLLRASPYADIEALAERVGAIVGAAPAGDESRAVDVDAVMRCVMDFYLLQVEARLAEGVAAAAAFDKDGSGELEFKEFEAVMNRAAVRHGCSLFQEMLAVEGEQGRRAARGRRCGVGRRATQSSLPTATPRRALSACTRAPSCAARRVPGLSAGPRRARGQARSARRGAGAASPVTRRGIVGGTPRLSPAARRAVRGVSAAEACAGVATVP